MQLEDYFEFHTEPVEYIRIKGSRIDIEHVVGLYGQGKTPEQIAAAYPTLELVQVYAAITYYLQHRTDVDAYMERGLAIAEAHRRATEASQPPSEAVKRIKAIKAARAMADAEPPP